MSMCFTGCLLVNQPKTMLWEIIQDVKLKLKWSNHYNDN